MNPGVRATQVQTLLNRIPAARIVRSAAGAAALACAIVAQGCWVPALVGVMAESYRETSTKKVPAEYLDLQGHSFGVIVSADRVLLSEHASIVPYFIANISERLRQHAGASGYVPPNTMIQYLTNNPRWSAMPYGELCEELGVDRLIVVEITEYRLHEPGNRYLWEGLAQAQVGIVESDGYSPDDFAFRKTLTVDFPDKKGYTPNDMSEQLVDSALRLRLVDRVSWLFYEHDEPYEPDY